MGSFDDRSNTRTEPAKGTRRLKWLVVVLGVVFSGALLASSIEAERGEGPTTGLPDSAQSTVVAAEQARLPSSDISPAIVVIDRDGTKLTQTDVRAAQALAEKLAPLGVGGEQLAVTMSPDNKAAIIAVPLKTSAPEAELTKSVESIRAAAKDGLPGDLRGQVTGAPAFTVDLSAVFDGADITLLATTAGVVALLLLITYRSPWLWLVPLAVVGAADQVAAKLVAVATHVLGFTVDDATTGITSVLVFGAGTNYALLLIARYREELRQVDDRHEAMRAALRRAAPAVLASSGTVILALLSLSFAQTPSTRSLGYAGAIGIATAVVYALVLLPAALLLFGRGLFWPFVPRNGQDDPTRTGLWAKVGSGVVRRPVPVAIGSVLVLGILATGFVGAKVGLAQNEQFRSTPEAVTGQRALAAAFPAGSSDPTVLLVDPERAADVMEKATRIDGVASVASGPKNDDLAQLDVVLKAEPASAASFDTIERLRTELGDDAKVGGSDAQALDAKDAAGRDRQVIIPLVLAIVTLILLVLLRSVVAAVVLVATVVATYVTSLGAGWWAFRHLFDFPALDLGVPLLGFIFLVALGVDYNIFLTTRAREEVQTTDTKTAIATALAVTGGVITSAGILLASVFTVLGVLPLITLTQLGIIVGFGVLLDTLLVRSLLVPALIALLGDRFWWPRQPRKEQE